MSFSFPKEGSMHSDLGIVLAEIQQTSDMTYRIYDWDRSDRTVNRASYILSMH